MLNSLLKSRGVSYSFQSGSLAFFALAILLPFVVPGKQISVSPLTISSYADTEVSTNIVFNKIGCNNKIYSPMIKSKIIFS